MQASYAAIQNKLDKLSVLPPGVSLLMEAMHNKDISFAELSKVLERFPTIAARLLAVANSAWSAPVKPILTLEDTCARLGFSVVRSISIALAIAAPFDPNRCKAFDSARLLCNALLVAEGAEFIARRLGDVDAQAARTAGLLHNIGLLLLADALPVETNNALSSVVETSEISVNEALVQCCGTGYDRAGAFLAEAIELPLSLVESIGNHNLDLPDEEHSDLTGIVSDASFVASLVYRQIELPQEGEINKRSRLPSNSLEAMFSMLTQQFPKTQELSQIMTGN